MVKEVGDETTNANGYVYVKTADRGWVAKHQLVAEQKLGRRLQKGERVRFLDGNRSNLDPENIDITRARTKEDRIAELKAKRDLIDQQIRDLEERS
jgi:hypothetical protein